MLDADDVGQTEYTFPVSDTDKRDIKLHINIYGLIEHSPCVKSPKSEVRRG